MSELLCLESSISEFVEENFASISAPFSAGIELSVKCNLKCVHCYAKTGITDKDLTTEQIKRIIDVLASKGTLALYFTGGEVFLRSDFIDIYTYARKKRISVSILSNITLLNDKILNTFDEYPVDTVSTTVYGITKETYERVTKTPGSYNLFIN